MENYFKELYPFKSNYIELKDGSKMHYVDEGSGVPIIMVHGNPTWSFYYRNLVKGLRDKFRCIVPDHIGCGFSDKPQKYKYTLSQHIENLNELVERLQLDSFHLIVHDWGGPIGIGMAMERLEKLEKLAILNTAAFNLNEIPRRIRACRMPVFGMIAIRGFNAFAGMATRMAVMGKMTKVVKKGYLLPYSGWKSRIATHHFVKDIPVSKRQETYKRVEAIEKRLPELQDKDVQIFWGGKDFCFNDSFYNRWQEELGNAKAHYYPRAGHYVLEDAGRDILNKLRLWL